MRPRDQPSEPVAQVASRPASAGKPERTGSERAPDDTPHVEALRRGDPEAFRVLYDRYFRSVHGLALGILGNEDDAADAVQDIFVAVWRARQQLAEEAKFRRWLWRISRNHLSDVLKKRRRQMSYPVDDVEVLSELRLAFDPEASISEPDRVAEMVGVQQAVRNAVAQLGDDDQDVILRRYFWGQSYQEIAEDLKLTEAATRQRLHRARQRLHHILLRQEQEEDRVQNRAPSLAPRAEQRRSRESRDEHNREGD